jgi:hypothetical protein
MIGWFTGGHLAIVTGGALAGGLGVMNKGCRDPSGRLMTGVALEGGGNMVGWFTGGLLPIVTGGTLAGYQSKVVLERGRRPSRYAMAEIATLRGRNMGFWFSISDLISMAIFTIFWSVLIFSSQMTLGAFESTMRAEEGKRGGVMIEIYGWFALQGFLESSALRIGRNHFRSWVDECPGHHAQNEGQKNQS